LGEAGRLALALAVALAPCILDETIGRCLFISEPLLALAFSCKKGALFRSRPGDVFAHSACIAVWTVSRNFTLSATEVAARSVEQTRLTRVNTVGPAVRVLGAWPAQIHKTRLAEIKTVGKAGRVQNAKPPERALLLAGDRASHPLSGLDAEAGIALVALGTWIASFTRTWHSIHSFLGVPLKINIPVRTVEPGKSVFRRVRMQIFSDLRSIASLIETQVQSSIGRDRLTARAARA